MKKVLICALTTVMVLSLANSVTYARAASIEKLTEQAEKTNEKIDKEISKAEKKGEGLTLEDNSDEIDKIFDHLINKTDKTADKLIDQGAKNGVIIEPYYVEVTIGGRTEMVDPCRVITVSD